MQALVEIQPKTIFNISHSNDQPMDRNTYTFVVKFSPHTPCSDIEARDRNSFITSLVDTLCKQDSQEASNESNVVTTNPLRMEEVDAALARFCIGGESGRQHLEGVGLVMPTQLVVGTLYCTNYALMFNPRALASEVGHMKFIFT